MAKKKKIKKAGIAKRQQNKLQKKVAAKRKLQSKKPVQTQMTAAKVKQNLKNLPSLVFEPELESIAFPVDEVNRVIGEHEKTPDQIEAIATPEFIENLKTKHQEMLIRFQKENDANKSMMVNAILYFMEQEEAPAFLNQIVVAMFYRTLSHIQNPEVELGLNELNQKLKEYDEIWADYLQEKTGGASVADSIQNGFPTQPSADGADEDEALLTLTASPFDTILSEFNEYLTSESTLEEETRERTVEDVEVLLNDYCEEKEITRLEDLKARKIRNFLEGWFIRMMNPIKEDMETMINSLDLFFQFALQKEKIMADMGEDIQKLFEDRASLLSAFEA
ncbi:MAG: hypothetical protein HQ517_17665 [SAR324 cluster bacterium]|nr:hypothetical protein [SAR324 cluster bacterium]